MDEKQNIINSWSNGQGAINTLIITDGLIKFSIGGDATKNMLGSYYLEFKVKDNVSLIGRQLVEFYVLNSKIGREASL